MVGGNTSDADSTAVAYEMITAGYVLVDDRRIFDGGKIRAGKPTPRKKYGEAVSMLASLMLQAEAARILPKSREMVDAFYKSQTATILGELYDQQLSQKSKDSVEEVNRLIEIARLKTGSLLAGAVVSGAIIGGGSKKELAYLDKFAMDLGTAYQLSDHIIDITGDVKDTGKDRFSDIRNSKKNAVVNHALSILEPGSKDRRFLLDCLGKSVSEREGERLENLLFESGSIKHVHDLVVDYNRRANASLQKLKSNAYRDLLSKVHRMYTDPLEKSIIAGS